MNFVYKTVWAIVKAVSYVFGIQLVDYIKKEKYSNVKKIHKIIVLTIMMVYTIFCSTQNINTIFKSYIEFIFYFAIVQENSVCIISILTEIIITFSKNDHVFDNIKAIDKHLKIENDKKIEFKTRITFVCFCYIIFVVFTNYMSIIVWGFNIFKIILVLKLNLLNLTLLKFVTMTHLNLCRLCLMNEHLRKKIISKRADKKSGWLLEWKFYPKNMEIHDCIEDYNVFIFIYSSLSENMAFISKKFNIFVSKIIFNESINMKILIKWRISVIFSVLFNFYYSVVFYKCSNFI